MVKYNRWYWYKLKWCKKSWKKKEKKIDVLLEERASDRDSDSDRDRDSDSDSDGDSDSDSEYNTKMSSVDIPSHPTP